MVLWSILEHINAWPLAVAHCNFHLRGKDSDRDTAFVKQYARQMAPSTPLYCADFDTIKYAREHGLSIEESARELRYNWFFYLCRTHGYTQVATAHHANDQAETVLFHLARGAGLLGASGIPPVNGLVVRPLLSLSRKDIITWAKERDLSWCEDATNAQTIYSRNEIRWEILPRLDAVNQGATLHIAQAGRRFREAYDTLAEESQLRFGDYPTLAQVQKEGYRVNMKALAGLGHTRLFYFWVRGLLRTLEFNDTQASNLLQAWSKGRGGLTFYSSTLCCTLRGGVLRFESMA